MRQQGFDFGGESHSRVPAPRARRVLSVSELTEAIQGLLEVELADIWMEGEISNLKIASSGHWYFSLKDANAQIRAVVWKTATRLIRFRPQDGLKVIVRGGVRVYAPRGEYQISVDVMEPAGKGALQQAFEQLKERLGKEGLFDADRKRPLPVLPRRIAVVTSPTGAVVRDILRVLRSRYANIDVLVYPARVQGPEAVSEIVAGIRALNRVEGLDVIILARGGGSLEDLWAFNEEAVARAIVASAIPILSAIGHETDFTIADFVADKRSPTPSAAAQEVVQAKEELTRTIRALDERCLSAFKLRVERVRARVHAVTSHRVFEAERGRLRSHAQRIDGLLERATMFTRRRAERRSASFQDASSRLGRFRLDAQLARRREAVRSLFDRIARSAELAIGSRRGAFARLAGKVDSLSPLAVLSRGYALVWDETGRRLLRRAADVSVGEAVRIRLHEGVVGAVVRTKEPS